MEASEEFSSGNTKLEVVHKLHGKERFEVSPIREKSPKEKLIFLPQTGLALKKLPPIVSDREVRLPCKTPSSPLVQMTPGQQSSHQKPQLHESNFSSAYTSRKPKEPQFVPYEDKE